MKALMTSLAIWHLSATDAPDALNRTILKSWSVAVILAAWKPNLSTLASKTTGGVSLKH